MATNVYQMVTDRIIAQLEQGIVPWQKPWHGAPDGAISYTTRKPYSILNQMLLGKPGEYLTFNQINELGGKIKKGAKSKFVVFYKPMVIEEKIELTADGETTEKKKVIVVPILRYYNVFHIDDTEGINSKSEESATSALEPIEQADQIITDYVKREKLKFVATISDKACYSPIEDMVIVPALEQYDIVEEYYSTTFHELVHSTGHKDRCNRQELFGLAAFGSENYSKEELVAEIGSAMMLNRIGIDTQKSFKNSTAYIQGWLKKLKSDNKFIISASGKAEKAVKYILNINEEA